jgi:hypothetical protein
MHLGSVLALQMDNIIGTVRDSNLKLTLAFGIGMHHAGLHERDRKTVEELFVNCKVQVLPFLSSMKTYLKVTEVFFYLAVRHYLYLLGSHCYKHISMGCKLSSTLSNY